MSIIYDYLINNLFYFNKADQYNIIINIKKNILN